MAKTPTHRFNKFPNEATTIAELAEVAALSETDRQLIGETAAALVSRIRESGDPGLMEAFLAEYGLSTDEGIALMCLAEALLRVPDPETIDALIEDKIAPSDWGKHLGHSSSSLVNASTWALMLTGRVLDETGPGIAGALRGALKRLGEPVIRVAARQAMREMGQQFVLGEDMTSAMARAATMEAKGYSYSYDMLGEAAMTDGDAKRYLKAYTDAIKAAGKTNTGATIAERPGVSVKLSALHPRYESAQCERVMTELVPRVTHLAQQAAELNIGLNIDAEEADRLELSLDVIEAALSDENLQGWDGFGVVVQAYGLRAAPMIDHLYDLAEQLDRRIMVRLVKGAYWDTEIKRAQVDGLDAFPVFTTKAATDVSYIACARKLLRMTDRIYPQFATHNAHTVAAVLHMSNDTQSYEFQRLHGMGEQLHEIVRASNETKCRIYAPVGAHRDLLAYLVRRLLENGANSSFVNQVIDPDISASDVVANPFEETFQSTLPTGRDIFAPRENSTGWDLTDGATVEKFESLRAPWNKVELNTVLNESEENVRSAIERAVIWDAPASERARTLKRAANLYEENAGEIFAVLTREAGKTPLDAVGELREAVDFLRYYAAQADNLTGEPVGLVACISPWNFPLAIFTGQIAGALSADCGVLAKPAEQTPRIAEIAVKCLHQAGVPENVLQLLCGDGPTVGAPLTSSPKVNAVAFTGSTETAQTIRRAMAENLDPGAPLVAETGGLNAMIVDSTALLEQAVRDVVASAFQSAGQRCSALRCLYVQADIAEAFTDMLFGAMDELQVGDPWQISTDVGPVIDKEARDAILAYVDRADVIKQIAAPSDGPFVPPTVVRVPGIAAMQREIFGPVLHLATFEASELEDVIADINATGYGLTFGLHTRIDSRVQEVVEAVNVGNVYVNRNQIGAVVGSQPFGGEGLSGTGPKAGGPFYPARFRTSVRGAEATHQDMPGPTGETNRLSLHPRAPFLCLGPGADVIVAQRRAVEALGGIAIDADAVKPTALTTRDGFAGALWWGDADTARSYARALAKREGAILPLITGEPRIFEIMHERHLCVDTTASGGNAALLADVANA